MNINWKVRFKNKAFWVAIIPAILLLVSQVLTMFGIEFDTSTISGELIAIVGTIFSILALLGIVNDPTTQGIGDSQQALEYEAPKEKGE